MMIQIYKENAAAGIVVSLKKEAFRVRSLLSIRKLVGLVNGKSKSAWFGKLHSTGFILKFWAQPNS